MITFREFGIIKGGDAIILNSVSNVNKAVPLLKGYDTINCYLDNDNAGTTALAELTAIYGSTVIDRSTLYSGFNDLNEYLTHQSFTNKLNDYENRQGTTNISIPVNQLTDATDNPVSTLNPINSMTKDKSINPTPAVNSNDSVDTINATTSNDEQPTPDAPIPPKQQRVGKQQRKSDFADFKGTYLMVSMLTKRHFVNIEESVWEPIAAFVKSLYT